MKTISKIIYTIIVCKFILGIRERLMSKVYVDPTKFLLIEFFRAPGWPCCSDMPTTRKQ